MLKGLDIYERVGRGVGHDEYIPFRVNNNQLLIDGETLPFGGSIYVEFLKVSWSIFFQTPWQQVIHTVQYCTLYVSGNITLGFHPQNENFNLHHAIQTLPITLKYSRTFSTVHVFTQF